MTQTPTDLTCVVTLQNCDSEPIHIPGAIQPAGALLAVDRSLRLLYKSANLTELVGVSPVLGERVEPGALPLDVYSRLVQWTDADEPDFEPFVSVLGGRVFDVIGHRNVDGKIIIEFESRSGADDAFSPSLTRAYQAIEKLRRQRSIEQLLSVAVKEIRAISGFDRVMAYRFHADDSGEVVRENRRDDLDDWEGRRYPASDIPAQARRLYIKNTLRLIADAAYRPVMVEAAALVGEDPLDLSSSVLRSVSPIHIEYMENMGVRASMSISIVIDGRLWGMIACHHLDALHVPYGVRMSCEVIAQILSATVASFEAQMRAESVQRSTAKVNRIALRVWNNEDILAALTQESPTPGSLLASDACMCLWGGGMAMADGIAPRGDMRRVVEALNATRRRVVSCSSILAELPDLQSLLVPYAGLLACRFDSTNDGWIVWLRREQIETVVWGGKPEKQYHVGARGPRLTPRGSFDEWREVVRFSGTPWLPDERAAAESLRDELAQISNSRSAEMDRARTALLAMLGHDLRDPLQSISMAAQLLSRGDGKGAKMGERIRTSSDRMQRLIGQVLDLSRLQGGLGLGLQLEKFDLSMLTHDLIEEARLAQPSMVIEPQITPDLIARADSDRIAQVIANLIGNAGKHGKIGMPVQVYVRREMHGVIAVSVVNDGDPIPEAQLEHLFAAFKPQSIGQARNRGGLGLGLYIADQIVSDHGGSLGVTCENGEVVFTMRLPATADETETNQRMTE